MPLSPEEERERNTARQKAKGLEAVERAGGLTPAQAREKNSNTQKSKGYDKLVSAETRPAPDDGGHSIKGLKGTRGR